MDSFGKPLFFTWEKRCEKLKKIRLDEDVLVKDYYYCAPRRCRVGHMVII
jgi:hypothetical protein